MTGAGAPGAAGIIKCLLQDNSINLIVVDADENAVGRYLHSAFIQIPKASDDDFIERLLLICKQKKIHIVLPLVTRELFELSKNKQAFTAIGVRVLVSSEEAIQIANNKSACYNFLHSKKIAVPKFSVVSTTEDFIRAALKLGHPQEPFCFKPSISNGSRGFRIVSELINESDQLFNYKPYNTYITYAQTLKILSSQPFPELLVTEYLPGKEYSIDCIAQNGKAILVVPREREKMINGISVQGVFVKDDEIISYAIKIIETIGLHGNIGIQVKRSATGQPLLLEINPRVQGTIVSALGAGVNLPLLAIKKELGLPVMPEETTVVWGTRFSRHWTEVYY